MLYNQSDTKFLNGNVHLMQCKKLNLKTNCIEFCNSTTYSIECKSDLGCLTVYLAIGQTLRRTDFPGVSFYSVRPKTWPLFKKRPASLCVSQRSLYFFQVEGMYMYVQYCTVGHSSFISLCGILSQDQAFHMAFLISQ